MHILEKTTYNLTCNSVISPSVRYGKVMGEREEGNNIYPFQMPPYVPHLI